MSQALYASLGQTFSPSDMRVFQQTFGVSPNAIATDSGEPQHPSNAYKLIPQLINLTILIMLLCEPSFHRLPLFSDSGGHESDGACLSNLYKCDEANLDTQVTKPYLSTNQLL